MSQFRQAHSKSYERGENEKFSPKDAKERLSFYMELVLEVTN